jgi:biopolymer transport protein ExbD
MAVLSEMNLTNLLDTTLVLILALLMVAPMMKQGISVQLPDAAGEQLNSHPKIVTISIAPSEGAGLPDRIYLDDQRKTVDEISRIIQDRRVMDPKLAVTIEADRKATFESVAQVISALKEIGVEGVDLPTEPVAFKGEKPATKAPGDGAR